MAGGSTNTRRNERANSRVPYATSLGEQLTDCMCESVTTAGASGSNAVNGNGGNRSSRSVPAAANDRFHRYHLRMYIVYTSIYLIYIVTSEPEPDLDCSLFSIYIICFYLFIIIYDKYILL